LINTDRILRKEGGNKVDNKSGRGKLAGKPAQGHARYAAEQLFRFCFGSFGFKTETEQFGRRRFQNRSYRTGPKGL